MCSVMCPPLQHPESGSTTLKHSSWLLTHLTLPAPCKLPAITRPFTVAEVLSFPECRVIGISVLVCSGCCHKITAHQVAYKQQKFISHIWEAGSLRSWIQHDWMKSRPRTQTSCVPTSFFMRLTLLMGASPSYFKSLPKAPPTSILTFEGQDLNI